jgi:hypothetical protein
MSERRLTDLHELIGTTEIIISIPPDLLDLLVRCIRHVAADESDPFRALGVLVEGIVHLLSTSVPTGRRDEAAQAVSTMLRDRMVAYNLT